MAHKRNTGPMMAALRCGAKTRKGTPCMAPAIAGKQRCRMHGGKGSGAPKGNHNAFRHGLYSAEVLKMKAYYRDLAKRSRQIVTDQRNE